MEYKTDSTADEQFEIDGIDVANEDAIDILTSLVQYEKTNGASGSTIVELVGEGPRKMAVPGTVSATQSDEMVVISARRLVEDGDFATEIEVDGKTVPITIA
jgi:hypothetical protein